MAAVAASLFFIYSAREASAAASYDIIKLPGLSAGTTYGVGINEAGEVTGWSQTTNGPPHAIVYSKGVTRDLGSLAGIRTGSYGFAINNRGQVAGTSEVAYGSPAEHAFLYENGIMTDLGTLGGLYSFPNGINDFGDVVGISGPSNGPMRGFIYTGGHMTQFNLATLEGINNRGQLIGFDGTNAILYDHGKAMSLGSLGGLGSYPYHINERGDVVGGSPTGTARGGAFLYADGDLISLGTTGPDFPYSMALGVNNHRAVVGEVYNTTDVYHAFIYQDRKMQDLNTLVELPPGLTLTDGVAINDAGQIVANGNYGGPNNYGFLLSPRCQPPVIESIIANPALLWPPNHEMRPVTVTVVATAACRLARSSVVSISSNDSGGARPGKPGAAGADYEITGELSANLRAEKSLSGGERVYTLTIECADDAGNTSTGVVMVTVPRSMHE